MSKKPKTDLQKFTKLFDELNQSYQETLDEYDCTQVDVHNEEHHAVYYFDEAGKYLGILHTWTKH